MTGETNLFKLINEMQPVLNNGEYVFVTVKNSNAILRTDILCEFKEKEGITLVLERQKADNFGLLYNYVASWITLQIHSSLNAVGMCAIITTELAGHDISCNIIAGFYHDHIFVDVKDGPKAIKILKELSKSYS